MSLYNLSTAVSSLCSALAFLSFVDGVSEIRVQLAAAAVRLQSGDGATAMEHLRVASARVRSGSIPRTGEFVARIDEIRGLIRVIAQVEKDTQLAVDRCNLIEQQLIARQFIDPAQYALDKAKPS